MSTPPHERGVCLRVACRQGRRARLRASRGGRLLDAIDIATIEVKMPKKEEEERMDAARAAAAAEAASAREALMERETQDERRRQEEERNHQHYEIERRETHGPALHQNKDPLSFNILDEFFIKINTSPPKYEFKLPYDKMHTLSFHGEVIPGKYLVVPDGLTIYLPNRSGDYFYARLPEGHTWYDVFEDHSGLLKDMYIRKYMAGSLISEHALTGDPFYENGTEYFSPIGLLEKDAPKIDCSGNDCSAASANSELIKFMTEHLRWLGDEEPLQLKERENLLSLMSARYGQPKEILRRHIKSHLNKYADKYFEGNMDQIIDRKEFIKRYLNERSWSLSNILNRIAKARRSDPSISGTWFTTFCRWDKENNDFNQFKYCNETELPRLPQDFFDEKATFAGVSDDLVRQASLASNSGSVNFKNIMDQLYSIKGRLGVQESKRLIRIKKVSSRGQSISFKDVCFIFQLKQKYN